MAAEACAAAKAEGNSAYGAGELEKASQCYMQALEHFTKALAALPKPTTLDRGNVVQYNGKGFGRVESAFLIMDEYFLKDLGTDQAIWVGEAGGDLRRFARSDLQLVPQELFDLRLACVQNLAAVKLKQEEFELAIKWADEALAMAFRSPKALMRKGAALLNKGEAGPASDALMLAVQVAPKDSEAKKLLRQAEKTRDPGWVCASGCCGPWGIGPHTQASAKPLNTIGSGSSMGVMKFGPSTAGQRIVAGDDSDSECSTCPSDDKGDCSKNDQQGSRETTEPSSPRDALPLGDNMEQYLKNAVDLPSFEMSPAEPASSSACSGSTSCIGSARAPDSSTKKKFVQGSEEDASVPAPDREAAPHKSELAEKPRIATAKRAFASKHRAMLFPAMFVALVAMALGAYLALGEH
jgi:tetratricopeptide (TPR) repeat protein